MITNKHIVLAAFLAAFATFAVLAEMPTNILERIARYYDIQMRTASGRAAWHGRLISAVVDPTNEVKIETYEDGEVFRIPATPNAAQKITRANAKIPPPVMTNGIPRALAEARIRTQTAKTNVIEVLEVITAGK